MSERTELKLTQPEPEAVSEASLAKVPSHSSRRLGFGRRTLAALTMATSATMVSGFMDNPADRGDNFGGIPIIDQFPRVEADRHTESMLERRIEARFGVEILNTLEGLTLANKLPESAEERQKVEDDPKSYWSDRQLFNLYEAIIRLPRKFVVPNSTGSVSFSIRDYGDECRCLGTYHEETESEEAVTFLSRNYSDKAGGLTELVAHELFHRYEIDTTDRSLRPELYKIFGVEDFKELREKYYPVFKDKFEKGEITSPALWGLEYGFMGKDGIGLDTPEEFLAELATTYLWGEKEFKGAGIVFGQEITDNLYRFYNFIYDGITYPKVLRIFKQNWPS